LEFQDLKVQLVHLECRVKKEFMVHLVPLEKEVHLDLLVTKVHKVHKVTKD
jgi:hypothetical protein